MTKFCPNCGEQLIDDAKFCKSCGKKIDTDEYVQSAPAQQQFTPPVVEKDYKWIALIGGIAGIIIPLIGIIVGIYLYTRKDSSKAKSYAAAVLGVSLFVWIVSFLMYL